MLTDPIADMLTRIRNANKAMHDAAAMPTSGMKEQIARLLKDEGYALLRGLGLPFREREGSEETSG